ncbi:MAG TPA: amidase family protein, partial [Bacillota bacterium]|nr:amidase family protein [Bacillota bacterium]
MSLLGYTIEKLEEMLHKKHISAEELVQMSIDRIDEVEDEIKAFITLDKEGALEQAKELDEQGIPKDAPFAALPIGIKDNLVTKNMRTTAA